MTPCDTDIKDLDSHYSALLKIYDNYTKYTWFIMSHTHRKDLRQSYRISKSS